MVTLDEMKTPNRKPVDLSDVPTTLLAQYKNYLVVGDTYKGQTFNGEDWLDKKDKSLERIAGTVAGAAEGVALNYGAKKLNKGDSDFAAAEREKGRLNREEIQKRAQTDAQRGYQIGSRDARVEADKDAASSAASQFKQQMEQQKASSGGGAAVLASMKTVDPSQARSEHRARADQQHLVGTEHQTGAESAALAGIIHDQTADEVNRVDSQERAHATQSSILSTKQSTTPTPTTETETTTTTTTEAPAPEDKVDAKSFSYKGLQDYVNIREGSEVRHGASEEEVNQIQEAVSKGLLTDEQINEALHGLRGGKDLGLKENAALMKEQGNTTYPSDNRVKHIIQAIHRRF